MEWLNLISFVFRGKSCSSLSRANSIFRVLLAQWPVDMLGYLLTLLGLIYLFNATNVYNVFVVTYLRPSCMCIYQIQLKKKQASVKGPRHSSKLGN